MIISSDGSYSSCVVSSCIIAGRIAGIDVDTGIVIFADSSIVTNNIIIKVSATAHHIRIILIIEMLNTGKMKIVTGLIKINVRCTNHSCFHNCINSY